MFARSPRWRRTAASAAAIAAAVTAAVAVAAAGTPSQASTLTSAAGASHVQAAAVQVPWSKVGPGWELAQYTTASPPETLKPKTGPTELYLISPSGTKYLLHSWSARQQAPILIAWSGDKKRALFNVYTANKIGQMTLATGAMTTFALPGHALVLGYTKPDGENILAMTQVGSTGTRYARYSLTGKLLKVLATVPGYLFGAVYSPDGTQLVAGSPKGLDVISNAGGIVRKISVPHTSPAGCTPERWWKTNVMLASCVASNVGAPRLWLVPTTGDPSVALTPQRAPGSMDLGDIGAWELPSGLYLQALGACGTLQIFKQAANGSVTKVTVPHTTGNNNRIVTVAGSRMLVNAQTACPGSDSLLWFNPATHAEQWLLHAPPTAAGVESVVAYYTIDNAA